MSTEEVSLPSDWTNGKKTIVYSHKYESNIILFT